MNQYNQMVNFVSQVLSLTPSDLSKEQLSHLEWFIKRTAVEAINNANKAEFEIILQNNDLESLSVFIKKYVPDFPQKFQKFLDTQ